jgi:hypothetical protein
MTDQATPPQTAEELVAAILETATVPEGHATHVDLAIRLSMIHNGATRLATLLAERDAVAPDLLAALEELQRLAWGDVSGHSIETYEEAKVGARKAIAAARKEAE